MHPIITNHPAASTPCEAQSPRILLADKWFQLSSNWPAGVREAAAAQSLSECVADPARILDRVSVGIASDDLTWRAFCGDDRIPLVIGEKDIPLSITIRRDRKQLRMKRRLATGRVERDQISVDLRIAEKLLKILDCLRDLPDAAVWLMLEQWAGTADTLELRALRCKGVTP